MSTVPHGGDRQQKRVTVAVIAAAVTLTLLGIGTSIGVAVQDRHSVLATVFNAAVDVAFVLVGAVITAARPRNRVGWLMLAAAGLSAVGGAGAEVAHHGTVADGGSVPVVAFWAISGSGLRTLGSYAVTLAVPAYFPTGRLESGRWRWLEWMLIVIAVSSLIDPLTDKQADLTNLGSWRNPLANNPAAGVISPIAFLAHVPLGLVVTVGVLLQLRARWRSGDALLRQQLVLFLGAAALPIVAVPIVFGIGYNTGTWVFGAAELPLPVAIGFAVLARGLYDLRTAANRTLVWVTLSAVIVGIYTVVIAGLGGRFGSHSSRWLAWVAAAVVAISFAPLRDALQRAVNRVTFGRWDEPYTVLAELGQRVEDTTDVLRLLAEVVAELEELGLRDVTILDEAGGALAGHDVDPNEAVVEVRLAAYGEAVGTLRYRTPETPLRARDHELVDSLAGHLGAALHAHRLTIDLERARERLVLAREEERRRLRRDLHDGLGPALSGHLLRLDLLAGRVDDPTVAADIDELRRDLRATVAEVRRVVEGLRPPALDELGLVGALDQVTARLAAGSRTQISLRADELPPLSAAVEVAAFRIVTEAVTNVIKHADATTCTIELAVQRGRLQLSVSDNGTGLASAGGSGHGLQTMRERAQELRGRLRISTRPGSGTTIRAEVPVPTGRPKSRATATVAG